MAISKKDLYKVFLNRTIAYAVFLAKEETDTSLLPEPLTSEEKELYDFCIAFASDVAERAEVIAGVAEAAEADSGSGGSDAGSADSGTGT